MRALRALAPAPDLYEPITNVVVTSRQQILGFTLQHLLRDVRPSGDQDALLDLAAQSKRHQARKGNNPVPAGDRADWEV